MTQMLTKTQNAGSRSSGAEIVSRLHSPEAHQKRRETFAWYAERRREDVRRLRERGLVLGAIAKTMGLSERTVTAIVNELEAEGVLERRPRFGRGVITPDERLRTPLRSSPDPVVRRAQVVLRR